VLLKVRTFYSRGRVWVTCFWKVGIPIPVESTSTLAKRVEMLPDDIFVLLEEPTKKVSAIFPDFLPEHLHILVKLPAGEDA
jgi:hypothetical protein